MRIGIDVREGAKKSPAGPGIYVRSLVKELIRLYPAETFILFTDRVIPQGWVRRSSRVRIIKLPQGAALFQTAVLFLLEFGNLVDIYFSPTSFIAPALVRRVPVVTTLFDFSAFRFAALGETKAVILERFFLGLALNCARKILVISQAVAKEAYERYPALANKLLVSPLAPALPSQEQSRKGLPAHFFLFVGTLEPRKNLLRLLLAYRLLKSRRRNAPALVLAGSLGWKDRSFREQLERYPFRRDVHVLGYVSDSQKFFLYRKAEALLYPSLYEGFGLPIVEAFASGCPVITSDRGAMGEVAGRAALLVDPENAEDIAEAMEQICSSHSLASRLREAGKKRAAHFSWQETAHITFQVFKEVLRCR